ncbi:hypothetical protein EV182_005034, partial [Spiromyces aspiralis]
VRDTQSRNESISDIEHSTTNGGGHPIRDSSLYHSAHRNGNVHGVWTASETSPVPRGILKHPNEAQPGEKETHLKWDEDNLLLNESQRTAKMKIDEPPTPYVRYDPANDTDASLDEFRLSDTCNNNNNNNSDDEDIAATRPPLSSPKRVQVIPAAELIIGDVERRVPVDDWDDESGKEGEEDEEAAERHRRFMAMRAHHYSGEATKARFRAKHIVDQVSASPTSSEDERNYYDGESQMNMDNNTEEGESDLPWLQDRTESSGDTDEEDYNDIVEDAATAVNTAINSQRTTSVQQLLAREHSPDGSELSGARHGQSQQQPRTAAAAGTSGSSGTSAEHPNTSPPTTTDGTSSAPILAAMVLNPITLAKTQHPNSISPSKSFKQTYGSDDDNDS